MPRPPHDSWVQGNDSGAYTGPVDKFLIHTTEGSSIAGAVGAYRANNSWPHLTVDCQLGRTPHVTGHLDLNVPARSLRNQRGGVETNRDGVIQIEVVGFATKPQNIDWVWLGANVVGPICRTMGIPLQSSVRWVAYPASYGQGAAQRLSGASWTAYRGVLGHQHCPENDHGDPGLIPIELLLDAAQEDDMYGWSEDDFKTVIRNIIKQEVPALVDAKVTEVLERELTERGSVVRTQGRVLAKLGAEDAIKAASPEVPG